uniref:Uncharacterized protein n=1 Tax=Globodera rostochiensis TaxID=31243 RepID=A0A914IH30_GLORO
MLVVVVVVGGGGVLAGILWTNTNEALTKQHNTSFRESAALSPPPGSPKLQVPIDGRALNKFKFGVTKPPKYSHRTKRQPPKDIKARYTGKDRMPTNASAHLPMLKAGERLALAHHKLGPGVVALHSSAFQEMDDNAPYRIAFLLLLIVSSVVLWASYKLICERDDGEEDGGAAYQPLSTTQHSMGNDAWAAAFEEDEASVSSQDSAFI